MSNPDIPTQTIDISVTVNGREYTREVPSRMLLAHFIRDEIGLTGTNIGCETSTCGCCSILLDGRAVKSCTMLVSQADGRDITTIEGLSEDNDQLNDLQRSFSRHHAQQCGFCTPGMVIAATSLLESNPNPTREEIKHGISGNLCRCTGYEFIIQAIQDATND